MQRQLTHFVQTLARGLAILEVFQGGHESLSLTQISQEAGINKAAVQRLTDTLVELGYLGRGEDKRFFPLPKAVSLGLGLLSGSALGRLALPPLARISREKGQNLTLLVLDGQEVTVLDRRTSGPPLGRELLPGHRLPAHATASGKVLLAGMREDDLRQRLFAAPLARYTPQTICDPAEVLAEVRRTRQRGYGLADREADSEVFALAAPLLDQAGRVVGAVSADIAPWRANGAELAGLTGELLAACRRISQGLGWLGDYPIITQS